MKPLWKVINIYMCAYTYIFIQIHIHIYMYICMYRYMCVCVFVCVSLSLFLRAVAVAVAGCCGWCVLWLLWWRRESWRRQTEPCHNWFFPQCPSGLLTLNSFIRQSEWLEESATCCSRPVLKLKMGKIHWFLWWTSESRDNHTWANFGKQN